VKSRKITEEGKWEFWGGIEGVTGAGRWIRIVGKESGILREALEGHLTLERGWQLGGFAGGGSGSQIFGVAKTTTSERKGEEDDEFLGKKVKKIP